MGGKIKKKLALLFSCILVVILSSCIREEKNFNDNRDLMKNTTNEQIQVSNVDFQVEYETVLYRKVSKNFKWQWSSFETIPVTLEKLIEEYKDTIGAFIVDYNKNEYFVLINTGVKPSSDYGFDIQDVNVVMEDGEKKEVTLAITVTEINDSYRFSTQQVDTRNISIIKIDRNSLPEDIVLNGVSIGL